MGEPVVVTVEPMGVDLVVGPGESVFDAAFRHGWSWPTNCYGQCRCTLCHVRILDESAAAGSPGDAELELLEGLRVTLYRDTPDVVLRLACQLRPEQSVRVHLRRPLEAARARIP